MLAGQNHVSLKILGFLSASLSWLPFVMVPSFELPVWLPLSCVATSATVSALLNRDQWLVFAHVSTASSFVGLCIGYAIWPPSDKPGIAIPLFVTLGTVSSAVVAVVSSFVASRFSVRQQTLRFVALIVLILAAGVGPTFLTVAPISNSLGGAK